MKVLTLLTSLIILASCSNELSRCVDANTNKTSWYSDNGIDKYIETYVKIDVSYSSFMDYKWLYDDSSEDAFFAFQKKVIDNRFGMDKLKENELYVIDCLFDSLDWYESAWSKEEFDNVVDWQLLENKYVYEIKKQVRNCIERNIVTKERAEAICNRQGIY